MGTRAPMPRWYDIPVVWLGFQALVLAGYLAAVRWLLPDLTDAAEWVVFAVGLVLVVVVAYVVKRSMVSRAAAKRS